MVFVFWVAVATWAHDEVPAVGIKSSKAGPDFSGPVACLAVFLWRGIPLSLGCVVVGLHGCPVGRKGSLKQPWPQEKRCNTSETWMHKATEPLMVSPRGHSRGGSR